MRSRALIVDDIPEMAETRRARPVPLPVLILGETGERQRRHAAWAMEKLGGHTRRTAEALGVDAKTLIKWLSGE